MGGVTKYTDAELEAMLDDLESDVVERKESLPRGIGYPLDPY